jgi:hypothetical protein
MAKSIRSLNPGDKVSLRFHGSKQHGNDPYEMVVECLNFNENKTIAIFRMEDTAATEFEAYQLHNGGGWGRFSYGAEPEKLTIVG